MAGSTQQHWRRPLVQGSSGPPKGGPRTCEFVVDGHSVRYQLQRLRGNSRGLSPCIMLTDVNSFRAGGIGNAGAILPQGWCSTVSRSLRVNHGGRMLLMLCFRPTAPPGDAAR